MASLQLELPVDYGHYGFRMFQAVLATLTRFPDNICFAAHRDHLEVYVMRRSLMCCSFKFPKALFASYDVQVRDSSIEEPADFLHAIISSRAVTGALCIDKRSHAAMGGTMQIFLSDENNHLYAPASRNNNNLNGGGKNGQDDNNEEDEDDPFDNAVGTADHAKNNNPLRNKDTKFRPHTNNNNNNNNNRPDAPQKVAPVVPLARPTLMRVQLNQINGVRKHINLKLSAGNREWVALDQMEFNCTYRILARRLNSVIGDLPASGRLVFNPGPKRFTVLAVDSATASTATTATDDAGGASRTSGGGGAGAGAAAAAANGGSSNSNKCSRVGLDVKSCFDDYKLVLTDDGTQQHQEGQQQVQAMLTAKSVDGNTARRFLSLAVALSGYSIEFHFTKDNGPLRWSLSWRDEKKTNVPTAANTNLQQQQQAHHHFAALPPSSNQQGGFVNLPTAMANKYGGGGGGGGGAGVPSQSQFPNYQQMQLLAQGAANPAGAGQAAAMLAVHRAALPQGALAPDDARDHMTAEIVFATWAEGTHATEWPKAMVTRWISALEQDPLEADSSAGFLAEHDAIGGGVVSESPARRGRAGSVAAAAATGNNVAQPRLPLPALLRQQQIPGGAVAAGATTNNSINAMIRPQQQQQQQQHLFTTSDSSTNLLLERESTNVRSNSSTSATKTPILTGSEVNFGHNQQHEQHQQSAATMNRPVAAAIPVMNTGKWALKQTPDQPPLQQPLRFSDTQLDDGVRHPPFLADEQHHHINTSNNNSNNNNGNGQEMLMLAVSGNPHLQPPTSGQHGVTPFSGDQQRDYYEPDDETDVQNFVDNLLNGNDIVNDPFNQNNNINNINGMLGYDYNDGAEYEVDLDDMN